MTETDTDTLIRLLAKAHCETSGRCCADRRLKRDEETDGASVLLETDMEVHVTSTQEVKDFGPGRKLHRWKGHTAGGIPLSLWVYVAELDDESRRREYEHEARYGPPKPVKPIKKRKA